MSAVISPGRPTAATRMSACRVKWPRSPDRLWQIVTDASQPPVPSGGHPTGGRDARSSASGLPTMSLRPTITTCFPAVGISASMIIRCTPAAVHGINRGRPCDSRPAFSGWKPSTSRSGGTASSTATVSTCGGSGNCTRIPSAGPCFSLASAFTRATRSAVLAVAATLTTSESMPTRAAASDLLFTYEALASMSPTSTTTSRGRRPNIAAKVAASCWRERSRRPARARPSRMRAVIGRPSPSVASGPRCPRPPSRPRETQTGTGASANRRPGSCGRRCPSPRP